MAISSNRSPSPVSNKTNLDSRTPEGVRKSSNGNPLVRSSRGFNPSTPANSPADLSRRNLGSKEGPASLRGSFEYKENERDQKRVKEGSLSKGSKSFMAPTISAISKISPSPRKKVLSERNDTVRSSITESDGKSLLDEDLSEIAEDVGPKSEMGFGSQVISEPQVRSFKPRGIEFEEAEADLPASLIPETRVSHPRFASSNSIEFSGVDEIDSKPHVIHKPSASPYSVTALLDSDPSFPHYEFKAKSPNKINSSSATKPSSSPSPAMAPLDSDPHLPPYDPKTNYLSPRPQFLHYKPKPRVEVYLKEEGKKLEDSFTSESCSDTDETLSSASLKELEDGSSSEVISEDDKETLVFENKPEYNQSTTSKPKARFFVRSKIIPFLLVFAIACSFFPVTDTPGLSPYVYKGQTFKFGRSAEFAKVHLEELASNIKLWSSRTVSYLSTVISIPRIVEKPGPSYFINMTVFDKEHSAYDENLFMELGNVETVGEHDQNDMELEMGEGTEDMLKEEEGMLKDEEGKVKLYTPEEEGDTVVTQHFSPIEFEEQAPEAEAPEEEDIPKEEDCKVESQTSGEVGDIVETPKEKLETLGESEFQDQENLDSHTINEPIDAEITPLSSDFDSHPLRSAELDVIPQTPDLVNSHQSSELDGLPGSSELDTFAPSESPGVDVAPLSDFELEGLSHVQIVVGILSAVFITAATAAYLYLKHKKARIPSVGGDGLPKKKIVSSSLSASGDSENQYQDRISSQPTELDTPSGPSEMSSSFKRSSNGLNDAQSQEKRLKYSKRDSLASSSSEYSYGSFTTYEKIHTKYGLGEEEVVTPVRRSSRIRKIISP